MAAFLDAAGREWTPTITGDTLYKYEEETGLSCFSAVAKGDLMGFCPGIRAVLTLLYLSVEDDAKAAGVTREDFRRAIAGESASRAYNALSEALFDFFPPLRGLAAMLAASAGMGGLGDGENTTEAPPPPEFKTRENLRSAG